MEKPKTLKGLVTMVIVSLILFWGIGALANGDPIWFSRSFNDKVVAISVYANGKVITLKAQDPGFEEISSTFVNAMGKWKAYEGGVVLSETTLTQYQEEGLMLEINYEMPVQLHSRYKFSAARTYLIPLSGTHANYNRVFGYQHTVPWAIGCVNLDAESVDKLRSSAERVAK